MSRSSVREMRRAAVVLTALCSLCSCATTPTAASPTPSSGAPPPSTCSQLQAFGNVFDSLGAREQPLLLQAEQNVDAQRAASVKAYQAAWARVAAVLSDYATAVRTMHTPPEIQDSVRIVADSIANMAAVASSFSTMSKAQVVANIGQFRDAEATENGAVSGMSARLGLAEGLGGCA